MTREGRTCLQLPGVILGAVMVFSVSPQAVWAGACVDQGTNPPTCSDVANAAACVGTNKVYLGDYIACSACTYIDGTNNYTCANPGSPFMVTQAQADHGFFAYGCLDSADSCTGGSIAPYNDVAIRIGLTTTAGIYNFNACGSAVDSFLRYRMTTVTNCCSSTSGTNSGSGCTTDDGTFSAVPVSAGAYVHMQVGTETAAGAGGNFLFRAYAPGACCLPATVSCIDDLSQMECLARGGTWTMNQPCAVVCIFGACCKPDHSCARLPQSDCAAAGGDWLSGVECASISCVSQGACCMPDFTCSSKLRAECEAIPGAEFKGEGTVCSTACTDCNGNLILDSLEITSNGVAGRWYNDCNNYPTCTAPYKAHFTEPFVASRIEGALNLSDRYGNPPSDPNLAYFAFPLFWTSNTDYFSVRWIGTWTPSADVDRVRVDYDGGFQLYLNGWLTLQDAGGQGSHIATVALPVGSKNHVRMDYWKAGSGSHEIILRASKDGGATYLVVPSMELTAAFDVFPANGLPDECESGDCDNNLTPDYLDFAGGAMDCNGDNILDRCQLTGTNDCNGNAVFDACELALSGPGLLGQYFNSANNLEFTERKGVRVDSTIDFDGDWYLPFTVNPDKFVVRWTGWITPPETGSYTFFTEMDDGERLWINNMPVVLTYSGGPASWGCDGGTERSGSIALQANTSYFFKLEYAECGGEQGCHLKWQPPTGPKEVIPSSVLRPWKDNNTNGRPDECEETGACCLSSVPCQIGKTLLECEALGGTFQGANSTCNACLGACCIETAGTCTDGLQEVDCSGIGRHFNGVGTICAQLNPSCDKSGACCDEITGNCTELVQEINCSGYGLRFNGVGSICDLLNPSCAASRDCNQNGVFDSIELWPFVNQQGLLAQYYRDTDFNLLVTVRLDADVNHDPTDDSWPLGAGLPSANDFSVRWVAVLTAGTAGNYHFRIRVDDGADFWLDGVRIINQLNRQGPPDDFTAGPIFLGANTFHDIRLLYREYGGQQVMVLSWLPPGGSWEVIPTNVLYSARDFNEDGTLDGCPVVGACCRPPYDCQITTQANCTGTYKGDNTTCMECPPAVGACCNRITGECMDNLMHVECQTPLHYGGSGSMCATLEPPCTPPAGCPNNILGDLDQNGEVNGRDIQGFVACALGGGFNCDCGDFTGNGQTDAQDIADFVVALVGSIPCSLPGDLNGDQAVNGLDISGFVACVLSGGNCSCGDLNSDGQVNVQDIPSFISRLLGL